MKKASYTTVKKVKTKSGIFTVLKNKDGSYLWSVTAPNGMVTCVSSPVKVLTNVEKNARSVIKSLTAVFK